MQPCQICGGSGVDPGGFCLTCRSFRGNPAPPPRRSWVLPAVLGSLGLLAVTGLVVTVGIFVLRNRPDPAGDVGQASATTSPMAAVPTVVPSPAPTAEPSPTAPPVDPLHDPCVIGVWRETSYQSDAEIDGTDVRLGGGSAIQHFRADGTIAVEYGKGVTRKGKAGGRTFEVVMSGRLTFNWQSDKGQLLYSNAKASGQIVWKINGRRYSSRGLAGSLKPERYTCAGDLMRQFGETYTIELARVGDAI
ncbi:hypothetical protein GCM10027290_13920 [Micromonospora sonneratiae]|uniref:Uncharacterized protein n=1 Tax=Micromonospora sonneratiae TaxID=1184706 RepID=A0ABW3YRM9_9ACTN